MIHRPAIRRAIVSGGVILALLLAGVTVRAAALWTESGAPLSVAPASVDSIATALRQERERSAALEAQITELDSAAGDLGTALEAARTRLGTDQTTADKLRASLEAARAKLVKLEAALKAAASRRVATVPAPAAGGSGASAGGERESREGDEEEHEDD